MICRIEGSNNGSCVSKGITVSNIIEKDKGYTGNSISLVREKKNSKTLTNSGMLGSNMERQLSNNDGNKCKLIGNHFSDDRKQDNKGVLLNRMNNYDVNVSINNYTNNASNINGNGKKQLYSNLVNDIKSLSISNNDSNYVKSHFNNETRNSSYLNNNQIEMRRKYYIKVTPLNTKYIAVVRTITNNTPLLLCFEHGKDRHPREVINLKNSNVYKGVTEKGPCICIRPKNESKYRTIEIVTDVISVSPNNCRKAKLNMMNNVEEETGSCRNNEDNSGASMLQLSNSTSSSSTSASCSSSIQSTKISSNSVNMYEVECHSDFELWCNFFASIGITLCNFRSLFHTIKLIGEGSFAKVYRGKNIITGEDIVLKAVDKKKVKESNVYTEIEVLRRVHHPHIVKFIASFEEEDHVCLVLEFLGGGELFEWIAQKGAYTEEQAKIAMKKVLLALQWLHINNVVHRDLKTENLILEHRNCPESLKIIDFGLAASLGSSAMKMRCGSPGYVAPEILEDKIYTTKVDVFSIGVVLYTLLGGSPPFPGSNMKEILKKNIQGNVQFTSSRWKNISSSVKDLIKWMMAKDPESRCSAAQAIYHPWFENIPVNPAVSRYNSQILSSQDHNSCKNPVNGVVVQGKSANNDSTSIVPAQGRFSYNFRNGELSRNDIINNLNSDQSDNNFAQKCTSIVNSSDLCSFNAGKNCDKKQSNTTILGNNDSLNKRIQNSININGNGTNNVKKPSVTVSSLDHTDSSHLSSSINSIKVSPRSNVSGKNHSNRRISSLLRGNRNNSSNLNDKHMNEETSSCKSTKNSTNVKKSISINNYADKKGNEEAFMLNNRQNLRSICYGVIEDDNIIFERPVIGNIITSSNHISAGSNKSTNNNYKNKVNRSSSIKAVIQNVFSRFSGQNSSVSIGRKYDIN
ncbi:Ser/Thr protein kinase [Cryptosporidium ryanae]|uniref:Ser/Thr protein kinase n=1 Tax=Cryptosporidium ryanae TaxID=515981 RepID=UPI00351A8CF2|nr:Ser/Thr protein kinase [Cryptosporidium ryanae]